MTQPGENFDTFVDASTIARVTGSHHRKVRQWAESGVIRTQTLEGSRTRYSLQDAHRLVARAKQQAGQSLPLEGREDLD